MKHDQLERLSIVQDLKKGRPYSYIKREYGVDIKDAQMWLMRYERDGEEGLKDLSRTHPTDDLKRQVIYEIVNNHLSLSMAAFKYNLSRTTVRRWKRKFREGGFYKLLETKKKGRRQVMPRPKKKEPETELERLRLRVEYLEAENALLKKVKALVEERESQRQKIGQKPSKN